MLGVSQITQIISTAELPRFVALWTQLSNAFSSAPPNLYFEVFNEPHVMSVDNLNTMNNVIVPIMRRSNPTRTIYLGGLNWMSPQWIISNPNAMAFPDTLNLRLEVHSYDPYNFCMQNPPSITQWGSVADQAALVKTAKGMENWSVQHSNIPVYLGEFGCLRQQTNHTARILWYSTMAKAWSPSANIEMFSIWDDDGNYMIYNRALRSWDQDVLRAIGL